MTREEAKELLPIIQAFAEGKTIQCRTKNRPWFDLLDNKLEMCGLFEYRIKPEPEYRPFKTKKECWNEMMKHKPFGWLTSKKSDNNVYISFTAAESEGYSAEMLFDNYKFVDGTPFGMCDD